MILITGATGFLGAEVARQLATEGRRIRCTKRPASVIPEILRHYDDRTIEWVDADIMDIFALEDALKGVKQVFHCAAWVSLKQADKNPMIKVNVNGTANLVNLCLQLHIRLVHVSSVAAIGLAKPGDLITENHHLDQMTETDGYAISKLESEMEVWRGIAEGLNAVIVNPSIIIGASAGLEGSGALFDRVHRGLKFYTPGTCGFVDVEDVATCMIDLMRGYHQAERYIISAENVSYKALTTQIANCFGKKPPAIRANAWMLSLAWRMSSFFAAITGKSPAIDKISAQAASMARNYDNSKIKKAIGMEFKPINIVVNDICQHLKSAF